MPGAFGAHNPSHNSGPFDEKIQYAFYCLGVHASASSNLGKMKRIKSNSIQTKPDDYLVISDRLIVSMIDSLVAIVLFAAGMYSLLELKGTLGMAIGLFLVAISTLYVFFKNILFRSFGCIGKKAEYKQYNTDGLYLRIRILLHNTLSLLPLVAILLSRISLNITSLLLLLYLVSYLGYFIRDNRIFDELLKIYVGRMAETTLPAD